MPNILAWHFCDDKRKLGFGDKRPIVIGETVSVRPPLELCKRGLHGSTRIIDALKYRRGNVICRVKLSGEMIRSGDKIVASHRTVLWMQDVELALRLFSIDCRERNMLFLNMNPPALALQAIETARQYLLGKATASALEIARNRAWGLYCSEIMADAATQNTVSSIGWLIALQSWTSAVATSYRVALAPSYLVSNEVAEVSQDCGERDWQSKHLRKLIGKARRGELLMGQR
jgi:hypothetical protein